jgi:3-hydroxyacyl-[acyl-carrier-protein] dehydratase
MLQGSFYTVLNNQSEDGSMDVSIEINPDHHIFEGHFPQTPVVPGVCMMQMVKELVEGFTGKKLRLSKADHLKFLTIINPRENKLLQVNITVIPTLVQSFQVTAAFSHKDTTFFKFKGGFVVE